MSMRMIALTESDYDGLVERISRLEQQLAALQADIAAAKGEGREATKIDMQRWGVRMKDNSWLSAGGVRLWWTNPQSALDFALHNGVDHALITEIADKTTDPTIAEDRLLEANKRAEEAEKVLRQCVEAMEEVEWSGGVDGYATCPQCCNLPSEGHKRKCVLALALSAAKAARKEPPHA